MAEFFDHFEPDHRRFVTAQPLFFVATAAPDGRVNLSPKGMDTLRVPDDRTVVYLDLTGSGNETAAHLGRDGRVTFMWCSFDRKPLILRAYGQGRALPLEAGVARFGFDQLAEFPGARQFIACDVESVQTSCGYAVPMMDLVAERQSLRKWAEGRDRDELQDFWTANNTTSIDGQAITNPVGAVGG